MKPKRPDTLTDAQIETLMQLVALGMYPSRAARKVGVTSQALTNRKAREEHFEARLMQAEAGFELSLLASLVKEVQRDPKIAMWILERRFPKRWGKAAMERAIAASAQPAAPQLGGEVDLWRRMLATVDGLAPATVVAPITTAPIVVPEASAAAAPAPEAPATPPAAEPPPTSEPAP